MGPYSLTLDCNGVFAIKAYGEHAIAIESEARDSLNRIDGHLRVRNVICIVTYT